MAYPRTARTDLLLQKPDGKIALRPKDAEKLATELESEGRTVEIRPIGGFVYSVWASAASPPRAEAETARATIQDAPCGAPSEAERVGVQGRSKPSRSTVTKLRAWWKAVLVVLVLSAFALFFWPTPWMYVPGADRGNMVIRINRLTGSAEYVIPMWPR